MVKKEKKQYHKGILCQLGFHKWGRVGTRMTMEGRAGKIIGKVCYKCGFKSGKGYFVADPIKSPFATKVPIKKIIDRPSDLDGTVSYERPPDPTDGSDGGLKFPSMNRHFINGQGWVIENGVKRKMTDADIKKLEKEMGRVMGQLTNDLGGIKNLDLKSLFSHRGNFTSLTSSMSSSVGQKKPFISSAENLMYCTCENGEWNKSGSHCKACKRKVRT